MRSRFTLALGLLAMAAQLGGPTAANAADPSPAADTVLRIGTVNEPSSANPYSWGVGDLEVGLNYDLLVGHDALGQPRPGFAESWTSSPDLMTWTFKIRPGMTWSDGQPADANDAAFTFNYTVAAGEGEGGPMLTFLTKIIKSATAPDPLTLVLTLTKPSGMPLSEKSPIVPEHVWKGVKIADLANTGGEPPAVGTGPFALTKWVHGQYQEFTRNEGYWGQKPALTKILVQFYKSTDAAVAALRTGEVDFIDSLNITSLADLAKSPEIKVVDAPWPTFDNLMINGHKPGPRFEGDTTNGPGSPFQAVLADVNFRKALEYSIDKQKLVDTVLAGHGAPGVSAVSPSDTVNYTGLTDIVRTYDPAKSNQLLDAAGYKDSNGDGIREDKQGKDIVLTLIPDAYDPLSPLVAQFIKEFFGQVGITVNLQSLDSASYDAKVYANDFDLALASGAASLQNRWDWFGGIYTTTGWNPPEYDQLKDQLNATADPAARKDVIAKLDRLIYEGASEFVLTYANQLQAYRTDRFTGWQVEGAPVTPITNFSFDIAPTFTALTPVSAAASPSAEAPSTAASEAPASAAPATPAPSAATTDTSGSSNTLPIAIVVIVIVAAGAILLLRRRGSSQGGWR